MGAADEGRHWPDEVSTDNARTTLVQLLARAGVGSGDAWQLIGLVEAGALALAHTELSGARSAPGDEGGAYGAGWLDGAEDILKGLGAVAERSLVRAVGAVGEPGPAGERQRVRRMEVERARVALTPLYLSFTEASDLDPEVTEEVLRAVLVTMTPRERAGYPGRLTEFSEVHATRLTRLFEAFGPGSTITVHGRYSLLHSVTSIAVLERLLAVPPELRAEWNAAELPPVWLDGLMTAWDASA
ncbi:hypothetical protein ACIGFK_03410 [Streptomyces sp. NPDC085524]|uniref:hypothetical protein n=1 Tax=unclassified Streptomyces TaxID=2593676 RepID=UPI0035D6AA90